MLLLETCNAVVRNYSSQINIYHRIVVHAFLKVKYCTVGSVVRLANMKNERKHGCFRSFRLTTLTTLHIFAVLLAHDRQPNISFPNTSCTVLLDT